MKKIIAFCVIAVIVIVSGICAFKYFFSSKTSISEGSTVTIQCVNKKVTDVSEKDAKELYNMLNDKELYYDSGLACPFRDDFCIKFDNGISKDTFYISGEGCGSIKYRKKYFSLSNSQTEKLENILNKYNITYPVL